MLTLEPTKDVQIMLSFTQGEGIRRRLQGGFVNTPTPEQVIADPSNVFLLAKENEDAKGFISLFPIMPGCYAIHLNLRTMGDVTKDFVAMAFMYAKEVLNAEAIFAIYPKSARAVTALCRHFEFKTHPEIEDGLNINSPVPYACEILKLS